MILHILYESYKDLTLGTSAYTAQVLKLQFLYWLCSCLYMNKCVFPETYLLKYQPSSFIVIALVLLKISNVCLFYCWFYAIFTVCPEIVQKMTMSSNVWRTMEFSYFMLEVLQRITEFFIHVQTSENCFLSVVKGFCPNLDQKI